MFHSIYMWMRRLLNVCLPIFFMVQHCDNSLKVEIAELGAIGNLHKFSQTFAAHVSSLFEASSVYILLTVCLAKPVRVNEFVGTKQDPLIPMYGLWT
uniref:Secreted protein n=1 Tax=Arundo donax TaxID=35708 RepID=A0A0A9DB48_ARUDO